MRVVAPRFAVALLMLPCCPLVAAAAAPPAANLAAQAQTLLVVHCGRCHGDQPRPRGGFGHVADLARLLATGQVVAGQPDRSPLFERVAKGEMPPRTPKTAFGVRERELLRRWIADGAPVSHTVARGLSTREVLDAVRADLEAQPARDRRFLRYLTLAHLASRPAEQASLRHALTKLVNSLSWHARLSAPRPLAGGLLLAVDLRHYRWNARAWDRLAADDPYQREDPSLTKTLREMTGSERPLLRADWFTATASRTPHYHDFLALPNTDRALERLLQVDVAAGIADGTAARAGFNGSGVARANRVIERHDALHGAYWRSLDFSDNTGRQNVFEFPLGPSPGPAGFRHAGGEYIFHLPNGLQGYFIADADGKRIDRAPGEIVSDPARPDRLVENGLSCMGCHVQGIIPKDDQIRAHVLKNSRAFSADVRDDVLALYVPARRLRRLVDEDNERFAAALKRLGVPHGEPEPVITTVRRYEDVVDLQRAASELDVTPERLLELLRKNPDFARPFGPLLARGTVQRQVFEEAFVRLAALLPAGASVATPAAANVFRLPRGEATALAWAADGRTFASGDGEGRILVWDVQTGKSRELVKHSGEVRALAFSPDRRRMLSAAQDRAVHLHDVGTGQRVHRLIGHTAGVRAVAFGPSGKWAVSAGEDRCLRIWDLETGKERLALAGHPGTVTQLAVSPDGRYVLSGDTARTVCLWESRTGKRLARVEQDREVTALAFSPDGERFLVADSGRSLTLYGRDRQTRLRRFAEQPGASRALSPAGAGDGWLSVYQAEDPNGGVLRRMDGEQGRTLAALPATPGAVRAVGLRPEGTALLAVGGDIHLVRLPR